MKVKIFVIIALLVFVVALFLIVPILRDRYFNTSKEDKQTEDISMEQGNKILIQNEEGDKNNEDNAEEVTNNSNDNTDKQSNLNAETVENNKNIKMFANITAEHCRTNCGAFASDFKFLEYCQEICGLRPVVKNSNCDKEKDLYKDYCLKNLAILKEDMKICNQIIDAGIRKTCQNRIAENIIEKQRQ